jgi:hypothetical protein
MVNKNNSVVAIDPSHTVAEAQDRQVRPDRPWYGGGSDHTREIPGRTTPETLEHHL